MSTKPNAISADVPTSHSGAQGTWVFIHGFLDSGSTWGPLIDELANSAAVCIAPDLRGAGTRRADAGPYTLDQAVDDVLERLSQDSEYGLRLVGHSMGAQIAELVAARIPDRVSALVLLTPTPLEGNTLPDEVRTFLRESGGNADVQREIRRKFSSSLSDVLIERCVASDTIMGADAARGYYDAFSQGHPEGASPARFSGPTLVIGAQDDPVIPPNMVRQIHDERFAGAALEFVFGSGHWPQLEQADQTARALVEFVGKHVPGSKAGEKFVV